MVGQVKVGHIRLFNRFGCFIVSLLEFNRLVYEFNNFPLSHFLDLIDCGQILIVIIKEIEISQSPLLG